MAPPISIHTHPRVRQVPENQIQSNQGRRIHPGSGRRKTHPHPKGRQQDPEAVAQVRGLLRDRPRRRDMLIEYLHLIQDAYHCLSAAHLAALAQELRLRYNSNFNMYCEFQLLPRHTLEWERQFIQ